MLGLCTVLAEHSVGELWDTGEYAEGRGPPPYRELIETARRRGVRVRRPAELCGRVRRHGAATLEVLAPCPGVDSARGANDNSFVVLVRFGAHKVLLTGDAEHEAEHDLARDWRHGFIDLLKVGHHGSRTSSTRELLAQLKPRQAVISSGVGNRFGHPHPEALARLGEVGAEVLRVDELGSVIWESDGHAVRVRSFARRR
jgi:competence protein ComEC